MTAGDVTDVKDSSDVKPFILVDAKFSRKRKKSRPGVDVIKLFVFIADDEA